MKQTKIEVGTKINKLTLLEVIHGFRKDGRKQIRGMFLCDCGNKKEIALCAVSSRKQKACGCGIFAANKLKVGEAAFNQLFRDYKWGAKRRKHDFNLTIDEFRELTKSNCFYCGTVPSQLYKPHDRGNGGYIYNGIDRIDNSIGYTKDNCISCCGICNLCKGRLSQTGFIEQVQKIADYIEFAQYVASRVAR